jgi:dTDP-glucose 4,6-dehydratase
LEEDYKTEYPHRTIEDLDSLSSIFRSQLEVNPLFFIQGDVCDSKLMEKVVSGIDIVLNFAAQSHVDRSIIEAGSFVITDVYGVYVLLEAARKNPVKRFIQIGTDEAYGSIEEGSFKETDSLKPNSPYAASKAAADLLVRSYYVTYGIPAIITRSSNNFGPYQYPEKLIPLFITNALEDKYLPLYGDGMNVRDWLYVVDNCRAIDLVLHKGKVGEIYNIGADNERTNIEVTKTILSLLNKPASLIKLVKDRPAHDRRYALDSDKIKSLGWQASYDFHQAIKETVRWYQSDKKWWQKTKAKDKEFQEYYRKQYQERESI